jgi:hypothetical protein
MARATFTDKQLCLAWAAAFKSTPKGTRGDVVRALMAEVGIEDNADNYRKMYNNVTQRHKQLSTHPTNPVKFLPLAPGLKGARRTAEAMQSLQDIFAETDDDDDDAGSGCG